jgi:hypothetical protein
MLKTKSFHSFIPAASTFDMDHTRRKERPDRLRLKSTEFEREAPRTEGLRSDESSENGKAMVETDQETKLLNMTTAGTLANHSSDESNHCEDEDKADKMACEMESAVTPETPVNDNEDNDAQYEYIVIGINLLDLEEGSLSSPAQRSRTQEMNEEKVGDQAS